MARARSTAAVLPALLPGLLVVLLAFSAGGFSPGSWAPLALVLAAALALRIVIVDRPFAGFSPWTAAAAGALALLGAWVLLSASWSHAPGRATVEFVRLLAYLLVLVLCGSLAPREHRLAWGIRGVTVAIAAVCVTGLITRLRPDLLERGRGSGRAPGLPGHVLERARHPRRRRRDPRAAPVRLEPGAVVRARAGGGPRPDRRVHDVLHALPRRDRGLGDRHGRVSGARLLARDAGGAAGDRAAGGDRAARRRTTPSAS